MTKLQFSKKKSCEKLYFLAIVYKLMPKKKTEDPEAVEPKNVDLEGKPHQHPHRFEAQIHKDIDTDEKV